MINDDTPIAPQGQVLRDHVVTKRPRILVIEDNPDMRDFLFRVLGRRGYEVFGAGDGVEGMEIALDERPDLILMDLSLPVLDGFEATRILKAEAVMSSVPILAVTAHARTADRTRALEAGCDGYLSKPYSIHELYEAVEQYAPLDK